MQTIDLGSYFVIYNLVIGVLLMLSSDKIGVYAGYISRSRSKVLERLSKVTAFTFGASITVISSLIYLLFYLLRMDI